MSRLTSGNINSALAFAGTCICPFLITLLLLPLRDWISPTDVAMLQLLWIAWMAQRFGKGWAIATTVFSMLLLNWCFVAPYYTLHVADPSNLISFVVMLSLGVFISYLSDQHQLRLRKTRLAMSQMRAMYMLAKGVNAYSDWTEQCQYASKLLTRRLKAKVQLQASPKPPQISSGIIALPLGKPPITGWIIVSETVYRPHQPLINAAQSLLSQSASALQLKHQAQQQQLQVELERHRAMLLRSLSHDLRTPLATIMGASSMLADPDLTLTLEQRQQQAKNIYQQSKLLDLHFEKVLELSKAQLNGDSLQIAAFSSDELIAGALARRSDLTAIVRRDFKLSAPLTLTGNPDLLEIALANMLENAIRYGQAPFSLQMTQQQNANTPHHNFRLVLQHRLASRPSAAVPDRSHGLGTLICQTVAALHRGKFQLLLPPSLTNGDGSTGEVRAELEWQA